MIKRDVGQTPQPQTADSSSADVLLEAQDENKDPDWHTWNIAQQIAVQSGQPRLFVSLLWGSVHDSAETQVVFIYLFSNRGRESADWAEHRSNLLQSRQPQDIHAIIFIILVSGTNTFPGDLVKCTLLYRQPLKRGSCDKHFQDEGEK